MYNIITKLNKRTIQLYKVARKIKPRNEGKCLKFYAITLFTAFFLDFTFFLFVLCASFGKQSKEKIIDHFLKSFARDTFNIKAEKIQWSLQRTTLHTKLILERLFKYSADVGNFFSTDR